MVKSWFVVFALRKKVVIGLTGTPIVNKPKGIW